MDGKWVNWGDAKGYDDFGWKDQWIFAFGAQLKATQKLSIRAGFNYGKNTIAIAFTALLMWMEKAGL